MAVVSNPLIGRARQSMGGATFSSWKGLQVLKNKAITVANPRTGGQLQQRMAFTNAVFLFRQMPASIKAGFKKQAVGMSEFNAFMKANLDEAYDRTVPGTATLLPGSLITGKGTIASSIILSVVASVGAGTITVTFSNTATQPGQAVSDRAVISAYNPSNLEATGEISAGIRSGGTANIPLPAGWSIGQNIFVYLSFSNAVSADSSNSDVFASSIVA